MFFTKVIKIPKNIIILLDKYYNKDIIFVFYIKYNTNIFEKKLYKILEVKNKI